MNVDIHGRSQGYRSPDFAKPGQLDAAQPRPAHPTWAQSPLKSMLYRRRVQCGHTSQARRVNACPPERFKGCRHIML